MTTTHHWLGAHGDEDVDTTITPEMAQALEGLDVPVPQPLDEPRWLVPPAPGHPETVPMELAQAARDAGCHVINSDAELRDYVEERGYALVPLRELGKVKIDEHGPYIEEESPPATSVSTNPKDAIGMTKPDLSLVPAASSLYQAQAMMDGARKYGPYNWRDNPVRARVYISAAQRHLSQYLDGEDFDPISGVHHLGHGLACLGILADARETGNLVDDRPSPGPAGEMIRRFGDTQSFK